MNWKASSLRRRLLLMLAGMAFAVLALALIIFTVAGTLRQQGSNGVENMAMVMVLLNLPKSKYYPTMK